MHLLGIRSRTQVTAEVLEAADRLIAVGCFCIGTDQVDLAAARHRGIPVFNAPFSNTRSVAELVMGEIVMLLRGIPGRSNAAHDGVWDKSATDAARCAARRWASSATATSAARSVLAEAFGMRVIYTTDPQAAARQRPPLPSLHALLAESDVVTLHVPETPATVGMIGEAEIAPMRPGARAHQQRRGRVVDLEALARRARVPQAARRRGGRVPRGARARRRPVSTPLQGLRNVILTPHIGGSTVEAQERIGEETAQKLVAYSDTGATLGAVNFPEAALPPRPPGTRFMHVHGNTPGILAAINDIFRDHRLNIAGQLLQTDAESATWWWTWRTCPTRNRCWPTCGRCRAPSAPG